MTERSRETNDAVSLPEVEKVGHWPEDLPFSFEVNRARLRELLKDEIGLNDDQIGKVRFTITPDSPFTSIGIAIGPSGIGVKHEPLTGYTAISRADGIRTVEINTGTSMRSFSQRRAVLLDYAFLSKQKGHSPNLEMALKGLNERITQDYGNFTEQYLSQVHWTEALPTIDKYLAGFWRDEIVDTFIHKASHLREIDHLEFLKESAGKNKERRSKALIVSYASVGAGLALAVIGERDAALGAMASTLVATGTSEYLRALKKISNKKYDRLYEQSEQNAKNLQAQLSSKWESIVEVKIPPEV